MSLKDMKMDLIVDKALEMFLDDSILNVTIKDISNELKIGEMTIYRYFKTKDNLILQCVLKLQKRVFDRYFNFDNIEGYFNKMEAFYNSYLEVFKNNTKYLKFIHDFDLLMISNNELLNNYADFFDNFKLIYMDIYNKGVESGEIKKVDNIEIFYYSTSKALLELCKKEASSQIVLKQDNLYNNSVLVEELIRIILFNLKA